MKPKLNKQLSLHDLLKNGINSVDEQGRSPVIVAIDNGLFDKADTIIAMGANLYRGDNNGRTPIDMIRESGNANLIVSVIKRGVNILSVLPASQITPEFLSEHPDILKLINDKAIDTAILPKETLLAIQSSSSNSLDVVRNYVENGGNVNWADSHGNTLLMFACVNQSSDTLKYLIDNGADVNASNQDGVTALMLTAQHNNADSLKYLLENKANINTKDNNGDTALMYAVRKDNDNIVKVLDDYNADATITNNKGENILFAAVDNESSKSLAYIMDNLVEKEENDVKVTELSQAVIENDKEEKNLPENENIVTEATPLNDKTDDKKAENQPANEHKIKPKKKKININHQDNDGNTALMHAVKMKNLNIIKMLNTNNLDATITNNDGEDILMMAVKTNDKKTVQYVLDNFVDLEEEQPNISSKSSQLIGNLSQARSPIRTSTPTSRDKKKIKINKHNAQSLLSYAQNANDESLLRVLKGIKLYGSQDFISSTYTSSDRTDSRLQEQHRRIDNIQTELQNSLLRRYQYHR